MIYQERNIPMIKIVSRNIIKEGELDHVKEILKELVQKSAAEEGNVFYTLNQDINEPNVLTFIECWKDQDAINIHNATEHFQRIVPQMKALCEGGIVNFYEEVEF